MGGASIGMDSVFEVGLKLPKISRAELERTLRMAWEFAASQGTVPRSPGKAKRL
jgi:hypothetical protein